MALILTIHHKLLRFEKHRERKADANGPHVQYDPDRALQQHVPLARSKICTGKLHMPRQRQQGTDHAYQ